MVRINAKKRRRGGGKVTRKPQKKIGLRVQERLAKEVRAVYDTKKSVSDNLANMGLVADPNNMDKSSALAKKDAAFVGFITNNTSGESKPKKDKLSLLDINYIKTNVAKHGEDFKAMEKDIKLNYMQHTARQMEKLIKRYQAEQEQEQQAEEEQMEA